MADTLKPRWQDSGSPEGCIRNVACHLDVVLSDEMKKAVNWHASQSVQQTVLRVLDVLATSDAALRELLAAGDACVAEADDIKAMLRFGRATDQARAALVGKQKESQ